MKLRNKIFAINAAAIVIVLIIIGIAAIEIVYSHNLENIYKQLLKNSSFSQRYLAQYLELQKKDELIPVLEENASFLENQLKRQVGHPVRLIGIQTVDLRPEQAEALKGNKAYFIDTKGEPQIFYFAFPVLYQEQTLGAVSYEYSLYELNQMRRDLIIIFSALFIVAMMLVFVLSYLFSYRLIMPLEKLQHTAGEFGRGNFDFVEEIKTGDEIESLAVSFNKMGRDIRGMINNLEEEQAKQKRFYDSVTHELRTPLTNIIGYADLAPRLEAKTEKEKCIQYIHQEGSSLLRMVEDLLDLSKLRQYDLTLVKKKENLREIVEGVLEAMAPRLKRAGYTVHSHLVDIKAEVDAGRIRQVLMNVIDNAIKHAGGDALTVKLWHDQSVFIEVADNGRGIPVNELDKIVEPFYRVEKSRSRKLGGVGLGLSICREIVGRHQSRLLIQSEPGAGTTVTICLQP